MTLIIQAINLLGELLILVVIVWSVLGWILSPYHPVRQTLDRFVEPLLAPIRKVVPMAGAIDFSPLVFIIVVQVIITILNQVFPR
jgi:YggT family protein